jgi:hypothetical protein
MKELKLIQESSSYAASGDSDSAGKWRLRVDEISKHSAVVSKGRREGGGSYTGALTAPDKVVRLFRSKGARMHSVRHGEGEC